MLNMASICPFFVLKVGSYVCDLLPFLVLVQDSSLTSVLVMFLLELCFISVKPVGVTIICFGRVFFDLTPDRFGRKVREKPSPTRQ